MNGLPDDSIRAVAYLLAKLVVADIRAAGCWKFFETHLAAIWNTITARDHLARKGAGDIGPCPGVGCVAELLSFPKGFLVFFQFPREWILLLLNGCRMYSLDVGCCRCQSFSCLWSLLIYWLKSIVERILNSICASGCMKTRWWHQLLNAYISNWSFGFFSISCEKVIRLFHILNAYCASIEIVEWLIIINIWSFSGIGVSNDCLDMIDNLFASMKNPAVASRVGPS